MIMSNTVEDTTVAAATRSSSSATGKQQSSSSRHTGMVRNSTSPTNEEGLSFPLKLHAMLEDADSKNFSDIVSWQVGNKSFRVHDVHKFGTVVMPQYFNQTKFKSFQRQLNIYGYRRIQHGPLKGGYVHKCFIRGRPELSKGVTRKRSANAAAASAVAAKVMEAVVVKKTPANRPDILQVAPHADPKELLGEVFEELEIDCEPIKNFAASVDFGSCNLQGVLERIFHAGEEEEQVPQQQQQQPTKGHHHHGHRHNHAMPPPVPLKHDDNETSSGGHFRSASGFVFNLTQDDATEGEDADMNALFDMLAGDTGMPPPHDDENGAELQHASSSSSDEAEADNDQESEEQLSERIFPLKLHKMLEHAQRDGIQHIVSWVNGGTGFKVHNSQLFTKEVMPMWFDQTKYESFRRQLNLYSFVRVSRGPQRGVYSHPSFISGRRDLLGGVKRKVNEQQQQANGGSGGKKGPPKSGNNTYAQPSMAPSMMHSSYQAV